MSDLETDFFVGLFAATVDERNFDLMPGLQELGYLAHLDIQVVLADLEAKTHLFHVQGFGRLAVFLKLLGALVIVFTPVNYLTNRRIGVRRNLYQV